MTRRQPAPARRTNFSLALIGIGSWGTSLLSTVLLAASMLLVSACTQVTLDEAPEPVVEMTQWQFDHLPFLSQESQLTVIGEVVSSDRLSLMDQDHESGSDFQMTVHDVLEVSPQVVVGELGTPDRLTIVSPDLNEHPELGLDVRAGESYVFFVVPFSRGGLNGWQVIDGGVPLLAFDETAGSVGDELPGGLTSMKADGFIGAVRSCRSPLPAPDCDDEETWDR